MGFLSIFGSKLGLYGALGAALLIAGMFGYIKYSNAVHARKQNELVSKLATAKRDIKDRDEVIGVMRDETQAYQGKVDEIAKSIVGMQEQVARNSRVRRTDYDRMSSPKSPAGVAANTSDLERRANEGMNGLFDDLSNMSQPVSVQ